MSDPQAKANPSHARTFMMIAAVEFVILTAGIVAYLVTDSIALLGAAVAVSTAFVLFVISRVVAKNKAAAHPQARSIVE